MIESSCSFDRAWCSSGHTAALSDSHFRKCIISYSMMQPINVLQLGFAINFSRTELFWQSWKNWHDEKYVHIDQNKMYCKSSVKRDGSTDVILKITLCDLTKLMWKPESQLPLKYTKELQNNYNFLQNAYEMKTIALVDWRLERTKCLLALNGSVYVTDKEQCCTESNSSKHQEETIAYTGHVSEEKWGLHEPGHVGARIVVIQTIGIDK